MTNLIAEPYYKDGLPDQRQVYAGRTRSSSPGRFPGRDEPLESEEVVMTVIIYGDFNCPYSYLAADQQYGSSGGRLGCT